MTIEHRADALIHEWPDGLPVDRVLVVLNGLVFGLQAMHAGGRLHRGVRPANILLTSANSLAPPEDGRAEAALAYAAPETFSGRAGPAVDVYALGCTLFEFLTGRPPFEGSVTELVHQHLHAQADLSVLSDRFAAIVGGCLAKSPEARWTLKQVSDALEDGAAPSVEAPRETQPAEPSRLAPKSKPSPKHAPPKSPPTPLDDALKEHLHTHGERWGDATRWQSFFRVISPIAVEHDLTERALIRRAQALLPVVMTERARDTDLVDAISAWVQARRPGRWSAVEWAGFLDGLDPPDEARCARLRDALFERLWPIEAGTTRSLELGQGVAHVLIYRPMKDFLMAGLMDAVGSQSAPAAKGIWHSVRPLSAREIAVLTGVAAPTSADAAARLLGPMAVEVLATLNSRFPAERLRWPGHLEYKAISDQRAASAPQATSPAELARRGLTQAGASHVRASGLKGLLKRAAKAATVYAVETARGNANCWLDGAAITERRARELTLVSMVPRAPR